MTLKACSCSLIDCAMCRCIKSNVQCILKISDMPSAARYRAYMRLSHREYSVVCEKACLTVMTSTIQKQVEGCGMILLSAVHACTRGSPSTLQQQQFAVHAMMLSCDVVHIPGNLCCMAFWCMRRNKVDQQTQSHTKRIIDFMVMRRRRPTQPYLLCIENIPSTIDPYRQQKQRLWLACEH